MTPLSIIDIFGLCLFASAIGGGIVGAMALRLIQKTTLDQLDAALKAKASYEERATRLELLEIASMKGQ